MNMRVSGTSHSLDTSRIDSAVQAKVNNALSQRLSAYGLGGEGGSLDSQSISDTVNALVQAKLYNMILKEAGNLEGSGSGGSKKASDGDDEDNYIRTVKADGSEVSDSSDSDEHKISVGKDAKEYKVQSGDTLGAIVKAKYPDLKGDALKAKIEEIRKYSGIADADKIEVGQTIKFEASGEKPKDPSLGMTIESDASSKKWVLRRGEKPAHVETDKDGKKVVTTYDGKASYDAATQYGDVASVDTIDYKNKVVHRVEKNSSGKVVRQYDMPLEQNPDNKDQYRAVFAEGNKRTYRYYGADGTPTEVRTSTVENLNAAVMREVYKDSSGKVIGTVDTSRSTHNVIPGGYKG